MSKQYTSIVSLLLDRLTIHYPAWKAALDNEKHRNIAVDEWSESLRLAGISSPDQIKKGLNALRMRSTSPFMIPPYAFVRLCITDEDLGLPVSIDKALEQALNAHGSISKALAWERSHPVLYTAWHDMSFELQEELHKSVRKSFTEKLAIFKPFYDEAIRKAIYNEPLQKPTVRKSEQVLIERTQEEQAEIEELGEQTMNELKSLFEDKAAKTETVQ